MTPEEISITIPVRVPRSHARAFLAAITGHDDDVMLAIEHAIADRLADEFADGEKHAYTQIELDRLDDTDREALERTAAQERLDLVTYGPYA